MLAIDPIPYDAAAKMWLARSGHYLGNPPPGALFAVGVRRETTGLFGPVGTGELVGLCVIGRPVARMLPQDGSVGEITRFVLAPGLPHGTASAVLRRAKEVATARGLESLIAYHDRTRHTGCIYKKAGFRRDGVSMPNATGWGTRNRPKSGALPATPKRRWRLSCSAAVIAKVREAAGR
jgi:antitoxin (DNA-binding transcriptional repressor) of toxin-antitoxin stability system